ncbi:MAG: glutamate 5-kinase [Candidatus Diapherotrites archaeon]|nr:glutamate 5-kinase [Candidatus Diapherotrites archaeon]
MNFNNAKRVVVKIGTNALMRGNEPDTGIMAGLVDDLCKLRRGRKEIILVTSGAVGFGKGRLNYEGNSGGVIMQQVFAAVGQNLLMRRYTALFDLYSQPIAQVLLTQRDFANKNSLGNLRNTLNKLLDLGAIPIVNENDVTATEELASKKAFSDNDMLAALVAKTMNAELLVVLTDVDGIYSTNPKTDKKAALVREISSLTALERIAAGGKSKPGRGGMKTKIDAAKLACKSGIATVITRATHTALSEIYSDKFSGTTILPKSL